MTNQNKDYSWHLDRFGQAVRDMTLKQSEGAPLVELEQSGLHATLCRNELEAAIQSHIDEHYIGKGEAEADVLRILEHLYAQRGPIDQWEGSRGFYQGAYVIDAHNIEYEYWKLTRQKFSDTPTLHKKIPKLYTESEVEQRCIEARVDEYCNHMPCRQYAKHYSITIVDLDRRIAELKSQLSTNNKDKR